MLYLLVFLTFLTLVSYHALVFHLVQDFMEQKPIVELHAILHAGE